MRINTKDYQEVLNFLYDLGDHEWSSNSFFTSECEIATEDGDLYTLVEDQSEYIINGMNYWEVRVYRNNELMDYYEVVL